MNNNGWHPEAQTIFANFIDENPYLLTDIFTMSGKTKNSIEKIQALHPDQNTKNLLNMRQDDKDKSAIFFEIQRIVVEQLEVEQEKVDWNSHLSRDLGADELDLVELIMVLEKEFDLEIPNDLLRLPHFLSSSGFQSSGGLITLGSSNSFYDNPVAGCTIEELTSFIHKHRQNIR